MFMSFNCTNINLKKGSTGEDVKNLQTILRSRGLYDGLLNGVYGDITTNSVKLLQRELGISTDGVFGSSTCKALMKELGTGLDCTNINLVYGSTGDDVTKLQTVLTNMGLYTGKINGIYGKITEASVKKLQNNQGNSSDGVFGSKTCKKLNESYTSTNTNTSVISSDAENKKFSKTELQKAGETFRKHIKNNNNYPTSITMTDMNGATYNVSKALYMGLFESQNMYAIKNGRLPNYVTSDSTANNPLCIDYQNNGYNCGPTSLSMCIQMFGEYISEPTIAKKAGTTSSGTGPSQLISAAKSYGYNMTVINRNSTAVKESLDKCRPVLMHIHTSYSGGKSCLGYRGAYGHYIMCYGMKNGKYLLADPTKGFKTCSPTSIDNARSRDSMKYYSISIK